MKTFDYKILIPIVLLIFGIIRVLFVINSNQQIAYYSNDMSGDSILNEAIERESITFILGEDKELDNPFYNEATNYYLYNEEGKTDQLITGVKSLLEVQEYLSSNRPLNNEPWGLVNLVSHGNQWLGLSVKVTPFSKRASTDRIIEYMENDSLIKLDPTVVDSETEIFIHACGLGNNDEILDVLSDAFAGGNDKPNVRASKLFEFYTSVWNDGALEASERYYADAKFISYKMGYKPKDQKIVSMLNKKYPNSNIDFEGAVCREQARFIGDTYHYTFEVPVKFVIEYKDSVSYPDLSTKKLQKKWISEQTEIKEVLEKIDIPSDKFNWWFRDVYVNNEDGTKSPAVWLKGYCTILCVLKPLTDKENSSKTLVKPLLPKNNDNNYFTSSHDIKKRNVLTKI